MILRRCKTPFAIKRPKLQIAFAEIYLLASANVKRLGKATFFKHIVLYFKNLALTIFYFFSNKCRYFFNFYGRGTLYIRVR
jgi:hypothetical protein